MTITARSIRRHGRLDPLTQMRLMPQRVRRQMVGADPADTGKDARQAKRRERAKQSRKSRRRNR